MNGKSNYKLKSLTIIASYNSYNIVNEKLSENIHFVLYAHHETQVKCILSIVTKTSHTSPVTL